MLGHILRLEDDDPALEFEEAEAEPGGAAGGLLTPDWNHPETEKLDLLKKMDALDSTEATQAERESVRRRPRRRL